MNVKIYYISGNVDEIDGGEYEFRKGKLIFTSPLVDKDIIIEYDLNNIFKVINENITIYKNKKFINKGDVI